jgi:hypothetical protein
METVRIRDPGWKKVGSGIRDKHPGSATLRETRKKIDESLLWKNKNPINSGRVESAPVTLLAVAANMGWACLRQVLRRVARERVSSVTPAATHTMLFQYSGTPHIYKQKVRY